MKGKRVATGRRAGRRSLGKQYVRRNTAAKTGPSGLSIFLGAVFVMIVAVKFLFPEQASALTQAVGKRADFAEAFAAVGRAVSGEGDVNESLQDAFIAVFNPSQIESEQRENAPSGEEETRSLSVSSSEVSIQGDVLQQEQDTKEEASFTGGYTMPTLPDNASLEQRNLGFPCTTPVIGTLSSAFGWREHPTDGGTKFHYGIDLAAEIGSDIVAFADGDVFAVGESSTLGKYIILVHSGGYKTLYGHCSEVIVKSGTVRMGEVIAQVGESGSTTGPHLHFELQDGALYLNPIYYVSIW